MVLTPGSEAFVSFRSGQAVLKASGRVVAVEDDSVVLGGWQTKLGSLSEAVSATGSQDISELCFVRVPREALVSKRPVGWPREKVPRAEDCLTAWAAVTKEAELSSGAEAPKEVKVAKPSAAKAAASSALERDLEGLGELWDMEEDGTNSEEEEEPLWERPGQTASKHLAPGSSSLPGVAKERKCKDQMPADTLQKLLTRGLAEGQSPTELMPLMMMSFMAQQQESQKRASRRKSRSSKDWDLLGGSSSEDSSDDNSKKDSGMKAVATLHKLQRRVHQHPRKVIASFEREIVEEMGVIPGQSWTVRDYLKKQHWGKFKGIYRCAVMDAVAYELLRSGHVEAGTAQLVQNMKAKMQSVIQNGDWTSAWLLTGIPDPLSKKEFGGTKEELAVISGYVNALQKIRKQVKEAQSAGQAKEEED